MLSGVGTGVASLNWWVNKTCSGHSNTQGLDAAGLAFIGCGSTSLGTNWLQANITERGHGASGGFLLGFRVNEATDTANTSGTSHDDIMPPSVVGYNLTNGSEFFPGQIAEIIYYNSVLTGPNITTNETYLTCRYGI